MIKTESVPRIESSAEEDQSSSGATWKAALIGTVLCALLGFFDICSQALGANDGVSARGFGTGALFLIFSLMGLLSLLKRFFSVRLGLRPQELLVIFSMLLIVSGVTTRGGIVYLIPHLAGFAHYATPENKWESKVLPQLPDGLAIKDPVVAKSFFEGIGPEGEIPYGAWVWTLCAWGVFLGGLYVTMISLVVILRKRWMEEERLPFPMAQLPQALVEGTGGEKSLSRNSIFWYGFSIPALLGLSSIVHRFVSFIPSPNLNFYTRIFRNSIGLYFYTHFFILGISYLVSLEVLGSILLFNLVGYIQQFFVNLTGTAVPSTPPYRPSAYNFHLHHEALGALILFVLFGLYEARHHLRDVFRKAFGTAPEVDDGDEMLSYRAAVVGTLGGTAFITLWLMVTGISVWVVPIFMVLMLGTFLGVTRILAESGVVLQAPLSPMQVLFHSAGTETVGASTMSGFFLAQPWAFPGGPHVMASASTSLKLTHRPGRRSRNLFYLMVLALVVGGGTAAVTLIHYAYTLGTYGFSYTWYVIKALNYHLTYYGGAISEPTGEGQPIRILWLGIGGIVMVLLTLIRKRLFWWPVHPVGFPIGIYYHAWLINVFLAWLIKKNVLKYGGPSLYGQLRPFFLGLMMGHAVITVVGSIIGILTGKT